MFVCVCVRESKDVRGRVCMCVCDCACLGCSKVKFAGKPLDSAWGFVAVFSLQLHR